MKFGDILMISLMSILAILGCDVDDDCGDGSLCDGGVNQNEDQDENRQESYEYVMILDNSSEENGAGTPGVDICGIWVECQGVELSGQARLSTDDPNICTAGAPGCVAHRGDANAAEDDGRACEGMSSPSDYVSLGMGGMLIVDFNQDLQGCRVHVVELDGGDREGAQVFVCANPAREETCYAIGEFETNGAGDGGGDEMAFIVSL
ncbi:hypothetical protein KKF91_08470 [Myxococcota bacterium]|nr:hypothetical protein [Myxococcota bacterium]MBU1430573.1 hypothetical protein [Myxococcota bacterium]MBU1897557.1 hypothetical protein [Myxococcota bacterium]